MNETTFGTYETGNLTVNIPAGSLPAGATITSVNTLISYTTIAASGAWLSELLTRITPPASFGPQRTDIDLGLSPGVPASGAGTLTNININTGSPWGTNNPTGNWTFEFATQFVGTPPQHTINNVTVQVNYSLPPVTPTWWTTATGGTQVGSGFVFDPTQVPLPDGVDVTQVDTTTYYAQCEDPLTGCISQSRTSADFIVESSISVDAGPDQTCISLFTTSVSLSGTVTGPVSTGTWSGGGGTFANPNSLSTTYTPTASELAYGTVTLTLTSADPAVRVAR